MKTNKKEYHRDFKLKLVKLSFEKRKIEDLVLEYGITNVTLLHWRKNYIINGEENFSLGKTKLTAQEKKIYDLEIKIKKADTEFEIIKGAEDLLHKALLFKYKYIAEKEQNYSSYMLCKILGVHLGNYKKWKSGYVSERQQWKMMIKKEITSIFLLSKKRYGYKRIGAELQRSGHHISSKTVRLYMRELNLNVSVKKYKIKK
ncbi:Transposase [compost metagenome]